MTRCLEQRIGISVGFWIWPPFIIVQYLQDKASFEMVKPVVVAAVANLIMAAPSFAEAG